LAGADAVPVGDRLHDHAGRQRLADNPQPILGRPVASPDLPNTDFNRKRAFGALLPLAG
jgi:hypothetical protein